MFDLHIWGWCYLFLQQKHSDQNGYRYSPAFFSQDREKMGYSK